MISAADGAVVAPIALGIIGLVFGLILFGFGIEEGDPLSIFLGAVIVAGGIFGILYGALL